MQSMEGHLLSIGQSFPGALSSYLKSPAAPLCRDEREGVRTDGDQPPSITQATVVETPKQDLREGRADPVGQMEIALTNGRRSRLGPDIDVEALRRVLAMVDG